MKHRQPAKASLVAAGVATVGVEELDDEQLMARIAQGDKLAFSEFVTRHLANIIAFATRHLPCRSDAEDVAQEAFTRLWQKAPQWQARGIAPKSWVYRTTYNLCIDNLRKQKPAASIDDQQGLVSMENAEDRLLQEKQKMAIDQALASLPERQRTAIVLCNYHGLSNRDAGAIMDISIEALESLLSRARRSLRTLLMQHRETAS